jgi:WD40 repeat protein
MRVWDAVTGQIVATHRDHRLGGNDAVWSPDGARIATSGIDQAVHIWDAASGETLAVLGGHHDLDIRLAWSPDGTRLATVAGDQTVRLWDAAASVPSALALMSVNEPLKACRWSPDGRLLAALGERSIFVIRAS